MKLVFDEIKQRDSQDIELKNGDIVQGTVTGVDISMNTHLKTVKLIRRGKTGVPLDHPSVRGNSIRFYILPETLNVDALLVEETPQEANCREANGTWSRAGSRSSRPFDTLDSFV